jgi:peroxiredoxin
VTYTATQTEKEKSILTIRSDDPLQPQRTAFLMGNQAGLGIGKPLPATKATLLDGSDWSSEQIAGKVFLLSYWATFCPVCSVQVRDFEDRFQKKYGGKIEILGLDANGDSMDGAQSYVKNLHLTYPIGLEDPNTKTYAALTAVYKGANPFPVNVIVGRDGKIAYVAREYDPDGVAAALDAELAKE